MPPSYHQSDTNPMHAFPACVSSMRFQPYTIPTAIPHLRLFKKRHTLTKTALQTLTTHHSHTINRDSIRSSLRVGVIQIDGTTIFQHDHELLAILRDQAALVVIIEEGVEASAVHKDVVGVADDESVGFVAYVLAAFAEEGVGVVCYWHERIESLRVGLHVAG